MINFIKNLVFRNTPRTEIIFEDIDPSEHDTGISIGAPMKFIAGGINGEEHTYIHVDTLIEELEGMKDNTPPEKMIDDFHRGLCAGYNTAIYDAISKVRNDD